MDGKRLFGWAGGMLLGLCLAGCTAGRSDRAVHGHAGAHPQRVVPEAVAQLDGRQAEQSLPGDAPEPPADNESIQQVALTKPTGADSEPDRISVGEEMKTVSRAEAVSEQAAPSPASRADNTATDNGSGGNNERPVRISLASALATATGQNPQVQFAYERIREAFADLQAAEVLWLPSIRAGASYNKHDGSLQEVRGEVFEVSRGASFSGLGSVASGTGAPAVPGLLAQFHLTDAVFQPRIVERLSSATQFAAEGTTNNVLRDVALAYLELLRASQEEAIARQTLENAKQLSELTESFARTGQGPEADADRTRTELAIRQNDLRQAQESVDVASVRLVRLLSRDSTVPLAPAEPTVVPIDLVDPETPPQELVATGLANRPEVGEQQHLVAAAVQRLKRERYAPLVPSVLLGVSYGGFGGGVGSNVDNYRDRFDVDVGAFWEVRNLGFGEEAARDAAHSQVHQAEWQRVQTMDRIAAEITEAHAQVRARRDQIETAEQAVQEAQSAYQRDIRRIRDGAGLPIEALQSLRALDDARREYLQAVIRYDEAQFRLHWALGWPSSPEYGGN